LLAGCDQRPVPLTRHDPAAVDPERKRELKRAFKREEKAAARAALLLNEEH
jgi:hypothetical protein